jgi:hypothetical protein
MGRVQDEMKSAYGSSAATKVAEKRATAESMLSFMLAVGLETICYKSFRDEQRTV